MSRYQPANQYSDNGGSYGNSYGDNGGYQDEPNGGYGDGGYGKYGGNGAGANDYPMSSSNPYASAASPAGYAAKPKRNKWLWIGLPLLLLIIIGAVLGGVLGTQLNKDKSGSSNSGNASSGSGAQEGVIVPSGVSSINTVQATNTAANRYLAVQTDTYRLPVYATPTATAGYTAPSSGGSGNSWPSDPDSPSTSSPRSHPRLIAPAYKWDALKSNLVAENPYFTFWNQTIMDNAEANYSLPLTPRIIDGGSGMLDVSRQIKEKVKNWSYAWRMTGNTKWANRVYEELNYAAGNDPNNQFGPNNNTRWYPQHFLDVAEMASAFAIGYDWCYDQWTDDQRQMLRTAMIENALQLGQTDLQCQGQSCSGWWFNPTNGDPIAGNWNCVINAGLTLAALAIQGDDTSGIAESVIGLTIPNAKANCFLGPGSDGSWNEGPNYWYFGTTGMGEMSSALTTAHGSDDGLATSNSATALTSTYHMYVQGMTSLFNYGDHGPNKFSSTANSLLYWSTVFSEPRFALYQRDRYDATEPFAMFWYDPAVSGTWWDNLPLDRHFNGTTDEWATGRSSWSDNDGTYWAMKGGRIPNHQNHLDMDIGDFVVDAMGQRWFGELGSGQYLADGYFSGDNEQEGSRWAYYRKRTEGQNTIQINEGNQLITATPQANFQSSNTAQGPSPAFNVSENDSAFFTLDMSSAYGNGASVHRGIRFLNGRKQFLIQDDFSGVASGASIEWRAHTNATVSLNGPTATLVLDSQTMIAEILNAPSGVAFATASPTRQAGGPAPSPLGTGESIDLPNPGVTVLVIERQSDGQDWSNQVLLNPQWQGMAASAFATPSATAVTSWSL